jgi:hypothetical protein
MSALLASIVVATYVAAVACSQFGTKCQHESHSTLLLILASILAVFIVLAAIEG